MHTHTHTHDFSQPNKQDVGCQQTSGAEMRLLFETLQMSLKPFWSPKRNIFVFSGWSFVDDIFSKHKSGGSQQEVLLKYNLFTCTHTRICKGDYLENTAVLQ